MPSYMSPGVYVEEVPSGSAPITGVSTSTAGFIGVVPDDAVMPSLTKDKDYPRAPAGEPQLITSWTEYTRRFGVLTDDVSAKTVLGHAVRGFFANGGARCWVTRLTGWEAGQDKDPVEDALIGFESIDEISLVAAPMLDVQLERRTVVQERLLGHCERTQDRFAVLDGPSTADPVTSANILKVRRSDYGALYFPWIDVTGNGSYAPPCGHIVGVFARVDAERGVHKAPANEAVRGAYGLQSRVSKTIHDQLNPEGINVLRPFGNTVKIWGARTLADRSNDAQKDFVYVNVRRLFCYLRESIQDGTGWVVFEPNTHELWARIARNLSAFLHTVWQSGALFGATPEEAFYVKCDAETNPKSTRDLGQVVAEIGVAVSKPAEFVVFRLSQRSDV